MNTADVNRETTTVFTGVEVENTPFKGLETLFVAYHLKTPEKFLQRVYHDLADRDTPHVYLGANQLYARKAFWSEQLDCLLKVVPRLVEEELCVTLDLPAAVYTRLVSRHAGIAEVFASTATCLLLSVPVSGANVMPNISLKLDDAAGVNGPNTGVWTTTKRDIELSGGFTPWSAYSEDKAT